METLFHAKICLYVHLTLNLGFLKVVILCSCCLGGCTHLTFAKSPAIAKALKCASSSQGRKIIYLIDGMAEPVTDQLPGMGGCCRGISDSWSAYSCLSHINNSLEVMHKCKLSFIWAGGRQSGVEYGDHVNFNVCMLKNCLSYRF